MDHIPFAAWVAFGGLIFTILGSAGGVSWVLAWKLSSIDKDVNEKVDKKLKDAEKFESERRHALRGELISQIAVIGTDLDHQLTSVRTAITTIERNFAVKVNEIELFIRDKYVLREDFRDDFKTITSIIDTLGSRIEKRLESFEEKLDQLQQFNMNRRELV